MKFNEAEKAMRAGKKVKLPKWENAYWYMKDGEIINPFEEGQEVPSAMLFLRDLMWVLREDWEIVQEATSENVCKPMAKNNNLRNFGWAIAALKMGKKVARAGWNGKKQYIQLATDISYKIASGEIVNCDHDAIGNRAIAFVGTSGVQMGWLASQADMLADDWYEVEE